ncbi:MAG TPA: response regulator [Anaerolineae bacterium]|nr:response regulator [Anaerolineae bacterium]HQK14810.1 response regulator [Anaerolineae bacterium]
METNRILIVDDDVDALRLVGIMLEREGFQILAAASGQQAIDKALEEKPDLIILDVMMPDIDGYQVAMQLRKHPATQDIPILMFTAKTAVNDKVAGFQAGADDYLTKPVHRAELITRIQALLQRKKRAAPETVMQERGQIIGFLPTKGGLGTSTLTLNVALELQKAFPSKQIALVEWRSGNGTLASQLGMSVPGGLQALAEIATANLTKSNVTDKMIRHTSGLHLLLSTMAPAGVGPQLTRDFSRTVMRHLIADYDYVLLDLPAALDEATAEALRIANDILMTLEPNRIGILMAQTMLENLDRQNIGAYKTKIVLINRIPGAASLNRMDIENTLQHPMICSIPPAPDLAYESVQSGRPMVTVQPNGLLAQQVRVVVKAISTKGTNL